MKKFFNYLASNEFYAIVYHTTGIITSLLILTDIIKISNQAIFAFLFLSTLFIRNEIEDSKSQKR